MRYITTGKRHQPRRARRPATRKAGQQEHEGSSGPGETDGGRDNRGARRGSSSRRRGGRRQQFRQRTTGKGTRARHQRNGAEHQIYSCCQQMTAHLGQRGRGGRRPARHLKSEQRAVRQPVSDAERRCRRGVPRRGMRSARRMAAPRECASVRDPAGARRSAAAHPAKSKATASASKHVKPGMRFSRSTESVS